ncbi:hypothetical protein BOO69_00080 [Sulfitobacter alexandrii]|uniref:Phage holin family protein n=1 Tax=Sulfitobacter alexandrii TaxID=1917485 RepID=A0A1J0WCD7_9RHOB|nr:hypothetical protein [Sulfitobacter alexandrii]APE41985.1 hypothetical protein BOO69_00080 [Sulfitobacter alexandrii]
MFDHLAQKAQVKAAQTAQTAALGLGASLLLAVGLGFLTAALWIYLVTVSGALMAALVIGAIYVGAGFVVLAVLSAKRRSAKRELEKIEYEKQKGADIQSTLQQLILAFVTGMQAGRTGRRG